MPGIGLCETIITTLLECFLIGTDFWIIVRREEGEHRAAIDAVLETTEVEQGGLSFSSGSWCGLD